MANLISSKNIHYKDFEDNYKLWQGFVHSEISGFYKGNESFSNNYSVILNSLSSMFSKVDLTFDHTLDNSILDLVSSEMIYQNFGDILYGKLKHLSNEDYRQFLKALLSLIFKGLDRMTAKYGLSTFFPGTIIYIEMLDIKRNTSKISKGMDHKNIILDSVHPERQFIMDSLAEGAHGLMSSKDSGTINLIIEASSDKPLFISELNTMYTIANILSSAIVKINPVVRVVDGSSFKFSREVSQRVMESSDGFKTLLRDVSYFPAYVKKTEKADIEDIIPADLIDDEISVTSSFSPIIEDEISLLLNESKIGEDLFIGSFTIGVSEGIIDELEVEFNTI